MLEKRFLEILEQYKEEMKKSKLTKNKIQRLKYISQCLDHLENEIDDLNLDIDKPEVRIYEELQKTFGPIMLNFISSSFY